MKVLSNDIDVAKKWKKVGRARGKVVTGSMKQHHAGIFLLIEPFLRCIGGMKVQEERDDKENEQMRA